MTKTQAVAPHHDRRIGAVEPQASRVQLPQTHAGHERRIDGPHGHRSGKRRRSKEGQGFESQERFLTVLLF